jgi:hypothetical protein
MSTSDSALTGEMLDAAIVAYVGRGRVKIPTADPAAAAAVDPLHAEELVAQVKHAIKVSDTVPFEDVAPFDTGLRARLYARLRALLPHLGEAGIEALGWRWGYLQFGQ